MILAKSNPPISLDRHIRDELDISSSLKLNYTGFPVKEAGWFWHLLELCIVFHDLGKAHPDFQRLLKGEKCGWHAQRHELFSLPFIEGIDIGEEEKQLIRLVVAGHHKDFERLFRFAYQAYKELCRDDWGDDEGKLSFNDEFSKIDEDRVRLLLETLGVGLGRIGNGLPPHFFLDYKRNKPVLGTSHYFELLLLAGAFKQCDHMASGFITGIKTIEDADFDFLDRQRQELLAKSADFYRHQQEAADTAGNTILTAPTGSGKTESACLWLQKQFRESGKGRVFYILPFTASINAMHRRLDEEIGNDKVGVLHGKVAEYIDSCIELQSPGISTEERSNKVKKIKENYQTLVTPFKVVTPFQLLKHLFGLKHFEKGIFEWSGGYFIFDEIHAYRPDIFAQIIVLLGYVTKYLGVKVFVMTATLPAFMRKELEQAIGGCRNIKATEALYDSFARHRVIIREGRLRDDLEAIQTNLHNQKRILVVCNTIKQAQEIFRELDAPEKRLLHGSFNAADRNRIERDLADDLIQLLVGTQAIEVSLDIDFDCIYTEPAPLDALIQRFGRVNRRKGKGVCDCIVFRERNKEDCYIYRDEEVIGRTLKALESFKDGAIEEKKLQEKIDFVYTGWNAGDKEEFDLTRNCLEEYVRNLTPFMYSSKAEEDFYEQFDGIKVLPEKHRQIFHEYLNAYEFIKAEALKVQISKRRYIALKTDNAVVSEQYVFEKKNSDELIQITYWVINRKYDRELGLLVDEKEECQGRQESVMF